MKTVSRLSANRLPTGYQQVTSRLPMDGYRRISFRVVYSYQCISEKKRKITEVIVLALYRHVTDTSPTVGRLVVCVCGKICQPTVGQQSTDRRPTVDQQSADRFFGELFFTITKNGILGSSLDHKLNAQSR